MAQRLFDRLQSIGRLPTLPEVVFRLLDLTSREEVSAREIANTIAHDSVMAAKIMRFINSPMAGFPRKCTSLERAVVMVGMTGVKMVALSFAVLASKGAEVCRRFDQRQFGMQCIGCGVAAKVLVSVAKTGSVEEPFLAAPAPGSPPRKHRTRPSGPAGGQARGRPLVAPAKQPFRCMFEWVARQECSLHHHHSPGAVCGRGR